MEYFINISISILTKNDPCFGTQEMQLAAPPVDKILSIYGINLKTEIFYFYKASNGLTKLELDPTVCYFPFHFIFWMKY